MLVAVIVIGLVFSYISGMHDGGTVIATAISSRLIPPKKAVCIAGIANMIGALTMGTAVSKTIFSSIVSPVYFASNGQSVCLPFVLSSLLATILWNYFTWKTSLPSSASHSMIGAMIGAGIAAYGIMSVLWTSIFFKVILAMFLSPVIGFMASLLLYKTVIHILAKATISWTSVESALHYLSSFFLALSYGGNDSQKISGLICIALLSEGSGHFRIPIWLIASVGFCLSIGTITGGYNIIKTVGFNITKVDIHNSCISQLSTVIVLLTSNLTGLPVSATQVVSASVMGVGTAVSPKAVNWSTAKKTAVSWIITIPASGLIGFFLCELILLLV